MRRLFTALGVDYDQWKALTIASLKLDLRTSRFGGNRMRPAGGSRRMVFGQAVFYVMIGVFMALFVGYLGDRFAAATLLFSYVILMVGTAMLVDHNAAITSPDDYGILGFQPLTSRTFFASKITNALVYTLAMTTALGVLPTGVLWAKNGVLVGLATVLALYLSAVTVTLAIVAGYSSLMRRVGAARLRMWLSYVQLVTGFAVYGGYFITSEMVSKSTLASFTLTRSPWLVFLPSTWFASYLEVAGGSTTALDLVPALGSVALVALLATQLRGRMSLEYAERLGELASESVVSKPPRRPRGAGIWFRRGEARAVAILVRGHFRNDVKFRMGVLAIIPMTVIYLVMGLHNGGHGAQTAGSHENLSLVTVAVMLFPVLLKTNLAHSDAFRASWVFFASPTDRLRLIRSSKNILVALFLVPYLVLVGITLAFMTHDPLWVMGYLLFVGCMSHVLLLLATVAEPELPFSKPIQKGRSSSRMLMTMIVAGVAGGLVPLVSPLVYANPASTAIAFAGILVVTLALEGTVRRRIERQSRYLEFVG